MKGFCLIVTLLLAASPARADQLLPTAEGTSWEYDSTEALTGSGPVHSIVTVRTGKGLLDGREIVKFETVSNNVISKTELVSVTDRGLVCLARTGKGGEVRKLTSAETIVIEPLAVGATWDQEGEVAGIKMHQHWLVVAEESVTVPAGQFQAFHLHCEGSSLMSIKLDRWFVPGTGFIKEATSVKGPGMFQRVTLELKKINEAPPRPAATPSNLAPTAPPSVTPADTPVKAVENQPPTPARKLTVEVSNDPAGGLKTEFKSDVANIYVRWHGHDLSEGARIRVAWLAEDVGDLVEPNFVIDETETVAPTPDASARFTLARPPDGWAEGKYRVEFYIDDILAETVRVTIGK